MSPRQSTAQGTGTLAQSLVRSELLTSGRNQERHYCITRTAQTRPAVARAGAHWRMGLCSTPMPSPVPRLCECRYAQPRGSNRQNRKPSQRGVLSDIRERRHGQLPGATRPSPQFTCAARRRLRFRSFRFHPGPTARRTGPPPQRTPDQTIPDPPPSPIRSSSRPGAAKHLLRNTDRIRCFLAFRPTHPLGATPPPTRTDTTHATPRSDLTFTGAPP